MIGRGKICILTKTEKGVATCWPLVNTNQGLRVFYHLWAVICLKLGVLFTMFFDFVFSFLFMFFYFVFSFFSLFSFRVFYHLWAVKVIQLFTCPASEKSPFTSGWKYFRGSTNFLWKVSVTFHIQVFLCYLKTIVSLFTDKFFVIPWKYFQPDVKGKFCQKQGKYTLSVKSDTTVHIGVLALHLKNSPFTSGWKYFPV